MTRSRNQSRCASVIAIAMTFLLSGSVFAQEAKPNKLQQAVIAANAAAEKRCKVFHNHWDGQWASVGTRGQFRGMAKDVVGDKVSQGVGLVTQSSDTIRARMRKSLNRHVFDEMQWLKAMNTSLDQLQRELLDETIELYVKAGVPRKKVQAYFKFVPIDFTKYAPVFNRVLEKARQLSLKDWSRLAAVNVGAGMATDTLIDIGRSNGAWKAERGSFWDTLGTMAAHLLIEQVADELTDPTDDIAQELAGEFSKAKQAVLNGEHGVKWVATRLTEIHIGIRNRDFGLAKKEVK